MIGHDRALELAAASIDFGLSGADDAALTEHLAECASCRAMVSELRADAAALCSLEGIDAPADLREEILTAIEADLAAAPGVPVGTGGVPPEPQRARVLRIPTDIPRPALLAAAAAIVIAVVGGTLWWRGATPPGGIAVVEPSSQPVPSGSGGVPAPSGAPTGGPSNELVTAEPQLARLTADDETGGVVALDSSFELAAIGGHSASDLAEHVSVQPKIEMTTSVEPDGRVRLTPKEPLTPGVIYRFSVTAPDGSATDSWAFQARQPLRIVSTLPGSDEADIPLDTGIEVTFDQDGVADAEAHFSIEPSVDGRFEQNGRILSFIPERRLRPATIYTVRITRGVTVEATGEILERDVRFRFETAGSGDRPRAGRFFRFSNDLFESATRDRPVVALWWFADDAEEGRPSNPRTARLDVYRFADRAAAIAAFHSLRDVPRWSQWNATENVPTTGLPRVASVDAPLRDANGTLWTTLPERLPAGWYLIEHPDDAAPAQAILQVTDISAYFVVSERRSVVWANDLATGKAIAGASVEASAGAVGTTDASGLLLADTPAGWLPEALAGCVDACTPIVTITSGRRSAFMPATGGASPDGKDSSFDWSAGNANTRYWTLFDTDRLRYRRTDTINAWGMVRERDSGTVPSAVEIRLTLEDGSSEVPLTLEQATPRPTGAFTGSLALKDVPEGSYRLELSVDGEDIASRFITVERILKPAYRIDVTTGRRVYVVGDRIRVDATARFFEGTPVPGVPVRIDGDVQGRMTTDPSGTGTVRGVAKWYETGSRDGPRTAEITARPARAEEGDGQVGNRQFVIFPSHWLVTGDASLRGRRVRISGTANELDRDRVEREVSDGKAVWELDPRGKPLAGRTVRARVVEEIPVRRQIGTSYDFVEKRVVPLYEYDQRDRLVTTLRLRTGRDGRFTASVPIRDVRHSYRIELQITDPDGLRSEATLYAYAQDDSFSVDRVPVLRSTADPTDDDSYRTVVGIDERVDMTMHEPDATGPVDRDRHLFFAAQGGIREATVRASDRYVTRFPEWGAPNVSYRAVRFTGRGYIAAAPYTASFRVADRAMSVRITPDRTRYAPGQLARLSITTLGADGRSMPATVILRGVDEKLFFIGGAAEVDPLTALYQPVEAGIVASYATHAGPKGRGGGADTGGGGGDGEAFNDTILFRAVDTDSSGRATVDMPLPADLTSWHVSASAIGAGLEAGGATALVPAALPFFVDTSIAPQYLAADRPSIQIRGFGSALTPESRVTFSIDSETLGLHQKGLSAKASQAVTVTLPKLPVGVHRITITGQSGRGATRQRHVLTRAFEVVSSRLTRTRTTYDEPTTSATVAGDGDASRVVVTDAGRGRLLPVLYEAASESGSGRLERALAADVAAGLLTERFGDDASAQAGAFRGSTFQREDGGIALLPYSTSDLEVSVLAALVAPERFSGAALRNYLHSVAEGAAETRERRNFAKAGLAGTGESILPSIRASLAEADLTVRERLVLAIGAAKLGDTETARRLAADLAGSYGEGVGPTARLRVGSDNLDDTTASALMAMLLAAYGDPVAARYWTYVSDNATDATTFALHGVGYVRWMVDHLPASPTRFAYVLGGTRTEVDLAAGDTFRLVLTRAARQGFAIEPIEGRIGVTTTWDESLDVSSIEQDADLRISRAVRPAGTIDQGSLVVVDLRVTFGGHAPLACHRVVDLLPSGLVPISTLRGYVDPETGEPPRSNVVFPDAQVSQRVIFCAEPTTRQRTVTLRYVARVISTGTYRWESALAESQTAANKAAAVPTTTVRIR